jgi:hypothetical protein
VGEGARAKLGTISYPGGDSSRPCPSLPLQDGADASGLLHVDGQEVDPVAPRLPEVDVFRRDVAGLSGFEGHSWLPVQGEGHGPFKDIDDFITRMIVPTSFTPVGSQADLPVVDSLTSLAYTRAGVSFLP